MINKEDGLIQYTGNASCDEEKRMALLGDHRQSVLSLSEVVLPLISGARTGLYCFLHLFSHNLVF